MKYFSYVAVLGLLLAGLAQPTPGLGQTKPNPDQPRLRSEGFLGFHFDFHASRGDTIGTTVTAQALDSLLTWAKPDYIQVDCKGHPGIASYPARVGYPAAFFQQDALKIYREVTKRHGVRLVVHFSGVWDNEAVLLHPDWARRDENGQADKQKTSTVGDYGRAHLIPQLKELIDRYQIDAAWVDGDCWAIQPDYSPRMVELFNQETGLTAPKAKTDSTYFAWTEFNRKQFRQFVRQYTDSVHRHRPGFQITSNWAFSSMMPEPVDLPLDFLSGDLAPGNSVYSAGFQARCLAGQGLPWDLMAWAFSRNWDAAHHGVHTDKSLVQLQQEAAQVLALGGGFQSYWSQAHDASLPAYAFKRMTELAQFCRAREVFCHKAEMIPQVAVLYSASAWKKDFSHGLYTDGGTESLQGVLAALLDAQVPVEVLMEHHLLSRLANYPVLVVPEWSGISEPVKQQLLLYARNGGHLLVVGAKAAADFAPQLGVQVLRPAYQFADFAGHLAWGDHLAGLRGWHLPVRAYAGTRTWGQVTHPRDVRFATWPLASLAPYGQGQMGAVYVDLGRNYHGGFKAAAMRQAIQGLLAELLPRPILQVQGSSLVHTVLARKNGRAYVHLLNTGGQHHDRNVYSYDELPPTPPLTVSILANEKPQQIIQQPENRPLEFTWENGRATVKVPPVAVHVILEVVK
ncbi:MAG: alpha-L-fucosidase [Bernardetiaceae bacterium]|jgi:hypothetical protein|nr:alpha-L-fucosidase [Bernardetiaceae bacterium]